MIGLSQSRQAGHISLPGGKDPNGSLGPDPIRLVVQSSHKQLGRQHLRSPVAGERGQPQPGGEFWAEAKRQTRLILDCGLAEHLDAFAWTGAVALSHPGTVWFITVPEAIRPVSVLETAFGVSGGATPLVLRGQGILIV